MHLVADLAQWWGLTLPQTLLVLALLLVIVDIFFQTDIPTHIAYVLVSIALAYVVDVQILFRVLVGVLAWFALVWAHYTFWREFVSQLVNRVLAPTKYKVGGSGLVGSVGAVKDLGGKKMVSLQGDLWPYECSDDPGPGAEVEVVGERDGVLEVKIVKEES